MPTEIFVFILNLFVSHSFSSFFPLLLFSISFPQLVKPEQNHGMLHDFIYLFISERFPTGLFMGILSVSTKIGLVTISTRACQYNQSLL